MGDAHSDLQFDRAEYSDASTAGLSCAVCRQSIHDTYFDVNGKQVCERCRYNLESTINGGGGSGLVRFVRASLFGVVAAALGAGIYYAVLALTNYELAIVAIIVGFLVGKAVHLGSNGTGGWKYQLLAVFLTYLAIVSTYVPFVIQAFKNKDQNAKQTATVPDNPGKEADRQAPKAPPASPAEEEQSDMNLGLALVFAFLFILAIPFLAGFQNFIGWIIIAIGLYEAWKLNRKVVLSITGPFQVASALPAAPIS